MKFQGLSLAVAFLAFGAAAHAQSYSDPSVDVNGASYSLVDSDYQTGEVFDTADGFCVKQGFAYAEFWSATQVAKGPYAVLDNTGAVVNTFAADGNDTRFDVITDVSCAAE